MLEVSRREGGGDTLKAFEHENHVLPDAPVMVVDGNRYLYVFAHPGTSLPASSSIGPGLRLLADDRVVLLPDRLATAGRSFRRWLVPPTRYEPASLPEWICNEVGITGDESEPSSELVGPLPGTASEDPVATAFTRSETVSPPSAPDRTPNAEEHEEDFLTPIQDAAPLPFQTYTELALYKLAAPVWHVKPWIAQGSLTVISGPTRTAGKTTLLLHMVKRMLAEESFLSEPTKRTGVAYLTEQSPGTFSRALIEVGLRDDEALRNLHVLYDEQVNQTDWSALMNGCRKFCVHRGSDVLIIDSLAGFGADDASLTDVLHRPAFVDPIVKSSHRGLATCVVLPTAQQATLEDVLDQLGALRPYIDTLVHVSAPSGAERERTLRTASRFRIVPPRLTIRLDAGRFKVQTNGRNAANGEAPAARPPRRPPLSRA